MCQAQSPEPQIGGCVGDAAQAVLYRVDGLMQKLVCKVKLWERRGYRRHQHRLCQHVQLPLLWLTFSDWWSPLEERSLWLLPSSMSLALNRKSSSSLSCRTRSYPWLHFSEKKCHICEFTFLWSSLKCAFRCSPCTFSGAGFHFEANKGREVSPEVRQALTGQQWALKIFEGRAGESRTLTC